MRADDAAFPIQATNHQALGLTKREYYACAAMQGLLANPESAETDWKTLAADAVKFADALAKALAPAQVEAGG